MSDEFRKASGTAVPVHDPLSNPLERAVEELLEIFEGIAVEGVELAPANRLGFYLALRNGLEFAASSRIARARYTLFNNALFLRTRLRDASPLPAVAPSAAPLPLFFVEGENPSVHETLRAVLPRFGAGEARAASVRPLARAQRTEHPWVEIAPWISPRTGASLRGVARAIRRAQRRSERAMFRSPSIRAWLLRSAVRTAAAARAIRRLFDACPTSVLVTASDTTLWGACATLEAGRRGIPSLTLQHGMMADKVGYAPVLSTRIAAWGEASARSLQAWGVPTEKIVVTGAPRFDQIVNRTREPRGPLARLLGADAGSRWIVLATNPIPFAHNTAMIAVAREGIREWGGRAVLLVKLHPSEDPQPYRALAAGDAAVRIVPHGAVHLYDLLAAADAVLTFHSSVGLEAMLLDRPVVSLEAFGEENPLPYAREEAAARARTPAELADILRREIDPGAIGADRRERRARFIRNNLFAADGKSAERVLDLIQALAAGGPA